MVFSEPTIISALNWKYAGNCKYKLACCFVFKHDWESDFFVLKQNGYAYEFEIKISRADFFNDKKKVDKHLILQTGSYNHAKNVYNEDGKTYEERWTKIYEPKTHEMRPNRFYYIVPEGLIRETEIPSYAGLMYISDAEQIRTIKEAPFIHKQKLDFEKVLCGKFYAKWIDARSQVKQLQRELDELKPIV